MGKINQAVVVRFRDSDIHFTEKGAGPALVLLHGFLEDSSIFHSYQEQLSSRFRTIAVDLPGHGASDTLGYVHTMDDMALAVDAVLSHLGIATCTMIGHSMGGYVTLAYAELFPKKLKGFGLFHSFGSADSEKKKADRERTIELVMRSSGPVIETAIPALFAEAARIPLKAEIDTLIARAKTYNPQGIVANLRGMIARPDRVHVLLDATVPVLLIHGLEDGVIQTEAIQQQAKLPKDVTYEELAGVAHMGFLEAPDICLSVIRTFAERTSQHG